MDKLTAIANYLSSGDGEALAWVFENQLIDRAIADIPIKSVADDSTFYFHSDEVKNILDSILTLNKSYKAYEVVEKFNLYLNLFRYLNRFAEQQPNWFIKPLIVIAKQLIKVAKTADLYIENNPQHFETLQNDAVFDNSIEQESCLIKSSRVIHNSFKLCLNDKNEDPSQSRRSQVYFFVNQELKIYFNLQNRELAKNMEKVLISKKNDLPDLNQIPKSQSISYLYYSGAIFCGDGDFNTAYTKFKKAYELTNKHDLRHLELILVYLIPLEFLTTKKYPNLTYLKPNFPQLYKLYFDLIIALQDGDLLRFEVFCNSYEEFFLKKNLYLVIESLRNFVLLKLVKKVYKINNESSHLPIGLISKGIEFASYHALTSPGSLSDDESECLLANLIFKNFIKGYLSHTNGVCVLSKKDPFPPQVRRDI
jgi:hypothetical protein